MELRKDYSATFLDDMTLGDEEMDEWVDSALSGSPDFVKEFLEMGEDSLEFSAAEDELRKLQSKLNDVESRESRLKQELDVKDAKISDLQDVIDQLKKELLEERGRAKDEAEDMAQEMAELRYQLTEMLEEERQLRARTERVSVQRVEELESQVKQARQEALVALARGRETETQAEKEVGEFRETLKEVRLQLEESQHALNQQASQQECDRCFVYLEEITKLKEESAQLKARIQEELEDQVQQVVSSTSEEPVLESLESSEGENTVCDAEEPTSVSEVFVADEPSFASERTEFELGQEAQIGTMEPITSQGCDLDDSERRESYLSQMNALEQKIRQIEDSKTELEVERNDLLLEVGELKIQVDRFRSEAQALTEQHSEALLRHEEERTLLQEEVQSANISLVAEVKQLQLAIEGKGFQNEQTLKELVAYQTNLEEEKDLTQELSARVKVLEVELQLERSVHATAKSDDEAMQKLFGIQAEQSKLEDISKNENEALQKILQTTEAQLLESTREKQALQENLQQLKGLLQNQDHRVNRLQQELLSQRTANSQLAKKVGELNSEVLILQQQLIICQTQVSEMAMKNVILENTVAAKKRKIKEGEQAILQQAEKLGRQEEKYFNLQAKFSALQNDFSVLEAKLSETRRKEQEIRLQAERVSLELNMAKQEVVSSEVRLQKAVKQAKEQNEELINKHKQTEWFLNRKIEHLERSELEKERLQQEVEVWKLTATALKNSSRD